MAAPGIDGITTRGELARFVEEQVLGDLPQRLARASSGVRSGMGSPEGVVAAKRGVVYRRLDGGAGTSLYVKEADAVGGDPKLGWVAK